MTTTPQITRRIDKLERLLSGCVDCVQESKNNVTRAEWEFAAKNLKTLFRVAGLIQRQRAITLRELKQATRQ